MLSDKEAKKKYRDQFYNEPDKYYATEVLKSEGFTRNICSNCGKPFWNVDSGRKICGDPACGEIPFAFIGNTPARNRMDYIEVWQRFSRMFEKFGYTPINRYPIVSRWNPTMEYTNASIAAFQPYVISGEIKPPAQKLIIPQLCFRTVDIDNVGITGSHNTVFCMIGQHMFVQPQDWDQNMVFQHIHEWLKKGIGLPNEEITFHEDAWAGGGNLGPCMEYFSRGNELGNQVYMMYEQGESGIKDLKIKVLDMGMGQERNAWFSQGVNTIYDATFPTVIEHLKNITGLKPDESIVRKYVPYSGLLNLDEVEDINKAWQAVSRKTEINAQDLKDNILPLAGLYSVAEHSRALLVMFSDGALPSNAGDSYNLRMIARRMMGFIDKYGWDVDINKLFEIHARYLKPQYPELLENIGNAIKILDVEKIKYEKTKQNAGRIASKLAGKNISIEEMVMLYDSQGIQPEMLAAEAMKSGKKLAVPDNFYSLVSQRHEKQEQKHATRKNMDIDVEGIETHALYYDDYMLDKFTGTVVKIIDNFVILDKTAFYPTSGGQLHDMGTLNGQHVTEVFKQGPAIIHRLAEKPSFSEGDAVNGLINIERRTQLAQHHTATHIVNAACRIVLGSHVNQSGAFKDVDKARIDITHYQSLSDNEIRRIEETANDIVSKKIPVHSMFMPRDAAEKKYGMRIYQGGVPPGKMLRIIDIEGIDVECCGGTHLKNTAETGRIKILKTSKISDSIVRIEFAAGKAGLKEKASENSQLSEIASIIGVKNDEVPSRANELFMKWKKARKGKLLDEEFELTEKEPSQGSDAELIKKTSSILKTPPEHLLKTITRFVKELEDAKRKPDK